MNPTDQTRVRMTVTVERNFHKARRSFLVERMLGKHGVMENINVQLQSEAIRLYDACVAECLTESIGAPEVADDEA